MHLPSRRSLAVVYVGSGIVAGSISFALGQSKNLEVFRHASQALLAGRDLYDGSSVDWFKYSPTFALLFVPLALMPSWLAAALWGALNFGTAFAGIDAIMRVEESCDRRSRVAALASLPGIVIATDGDQANLLVAGAMLFAFSAFERQKTLSAAAAVVLGGLVKIFPLAAALFALLHRDRERSLFRIIVMLGVGVAMPLVVLRPAALAAEYGSWVSLLGADHANRGWSLVTVVRDLGGNAMTTQLAAVAMAVLPVVGALVVPGVFVDRRFRRQFAASLFILLVLCNHRSEYTSFVISAIGLGIWFTDGPRTTWRIALLMLASIAHGPIFVRDDPAVGGLLSVLAAHRLYHPLRLVPLVAVWILLQRDLLRALLDAAGRRQGASQSAAE